MDESVLPSDVVEVLVAHQKTDDEDDQYVLRHLLCDLREYGRHLYVLREACLRLYVHDADLYDHRLHANPSLQVAA